MNIRSHKKGGGYESTLDDIDRVFVLQRFNSDFTCNFSSNDYQYLDEEVGLNQLRPKPPVACASRGF